MRFKSLVIFSFSLFLLGSNLFSPQAFAVEPEVPNSLELIDSDISQSVDLEVIKSYLSEEQINKFNNNDLELSPLSLDHMKYTDYFYLSTSNWITRDGVISLSLRPILNSPLRTTSGNILLGHALRAYQLVYSRFSSHYNWRNSTGMSHQFHCHVQFAGDKTTWNLEPHRTETNYLVYLQHGCNPPN